MKRDFDLLRTLLHVIENVGVQPQSLVNTYGLSVNDSRVQYHLRLLVDAGYVRGYCQTSDGHVCVRLTWQGHELLELTRNEAVWARAKKLVERQTQGMSITSLHAVLTRWAEEVVTSTDNWIPDSRPPHDSSRNDALPRATARRFVPPPTVHPHRHYRDRGYTDDQFAMQVPQSTNGNGAHTHETADHPGSNGYSGSNGREHNGQPNGSGESTFQFHVWSGHIDTLPLYLL